MLHLSVSNVDRVWAMSWQQWEQAQLNQPAELYKKIPAAKENDLPLCHCFSTVVTFALTPAVHSEKMIVPVLYLPHSAQKAHSHPCTSSYF